MSARAARERTAVVVVGACGGCGASMIAGALALAWARDDARVWLMELDLERGDRGGAWDLPAERTLDDLAAVADELDSGHLNRAVHAHPSGVTRGSCGRRIEGDAVVRDRGRAAARRRAGR